MTPDALGGEISNPQSLNRYAYALNNPTTLTDPLGLDTQPCMIDGQEGLCTTTTAAGSSDDYLLWPVWQFDFCAAFPFACGAPQPAFGFGGGGGGGGAPTPKPTPAPLRPTIPQRLACAANFGDTHSFAGLLGIQHNLVGNLFLGNSVSGIVELGQTVFGSAAPTGGQIATTLLGGAGQGVPVAGEHPGISGAAGIAQDAFAKAGINAAYNAVRGVGAEPIELGITASGKVASIAVPLSEATVSTVTSGVNLAKFSYDLVDFGVGYYECGK